MSWQPNSLACQKKKKRGCVMRTSTIRDKDQRTQRFGNKPNKKESFFCDGTCKSSSEEEIFLFFLRSFLISVVIKMSDTALLVIEWSRGPQEHENLKTFDFCVLFYRLYCRDTNCRKMRWIFFNYIKQNIWLRTPMDIDNDLFVGY